MMPTYVIPAATPTLIFTPTTGITNTLQLQNIGASPVYVGDVNVQPNSGFLVTPGKPVNYQPGVYQTVYTCAYSAVGANTSACTTSAAVAAGASSVPVNSGYSTNITVGSTLFLNNAGKGGEYVTVSATAATTITTSATLYDHASGSKGTVATTSFSNLKVTPGVL